jgi:hypothetical protein
VGVLSGCESPSVGDGWARTFIQQQPNHVPVTSGACYVQGSLSHGILGVDFDVSSIQKKFGDALLSLVLFGFFSPKRGYPVHCIYERSVRVVYVGDTRVCGCSCACPRGAYCIEFCGTVQGSSLRPIGLGVERRFSDICG